MAISLQASRAPDENPPPTQLSLQSFVQKNNFEAVRAYIHKAKAQEESWRWSFDDKVPDACRDAILLGHEKIVQLFLDEGLSADAYAHKRGDRGCVLPLKHFAAKIGSLQMVQLLVSKGAKIIDTSRFRDESDDQDAMRASVKKGHSHIVRYLLENGGSVDGCLNKGFHNNQTYLGYAAYHGSKQLFELLAGHGANVKTALSLNEKSFRELFQRYENSLKFEYSDANRKSRLQYCTDADMKEWDQKKETLIEKRNSMLKQYSQAVQMLLDRAIAIDLDGEKSGIFCANYGGLLFLKELDISGFNFVGVSLDGKPITRKMLLDQGLKGAERALVSLDDIASITDSERKEALKERLNAKFLAQGKIISADGIVNLVPLQIAASKGVHEVVLVRLSYGVDPNSDSAIVAAAEGGFEEVVRLLAEHPQLDPKSRLTAAQSAKKNGHLAIAEYLSSLQGVDEKDHEGNAAIHKAAEASDIEAIERLLKRGADINLANGRGLTPLAIAASNCGNIHWGKKASKKAIELLQFLLKNNANPNLHQGISPLQRAAKCGSFQAVNLLLSVTEKTDIKDTDLWGQEFTQPWYVPLMFDSLGSVEWLEILRLLKANGADLNAVARSGDETLLYRFVRNFPSFDNIRSTMRQLQLAIRGCEDRLGPNPLKKEYEQLVLQAHDRHQTMIKQLDFLLQNGADPKIACGRDKNTVLHLLIEKIDLSFIQDATEEVIDRFISYGIDSNASDEYGYTPLHAAASSGDLIAAGYLIQKGANVQARSKKGYTPLHFAAAGKPQTTKLLIEAGADVNAIDAEGLTPLAFSQKACIDNNKRYVHPSREREEPYLEAQRELSKANAPRIVQNENEKRQATLILNKKKELESRSTTQTLLQDLVELEGALLCPISKKIMTEPVFSSKSGKTYDKASMSQSVRCPLTGIELAAADIVPNYVMSHSIGLYQEKLVPLKLALKAIEDKSQNVDEPTEKQIAAMKGLHSALLKTLKDFEELFTCSISQEVMKEPTISTVSGQTYDKESILQCLMRKHECPLSRKNMTAADLKPNEAVSTLITLYQEILVRIKLALTKINNP